jgi:hypothetical protein
VVTGPVVIGPALAALMVATDQEVEIVLAVVVIGPVEIVPVLAGLEAIVPAVIGRESPGRPAVKTDHRIGTSTDRLFDRAGRVDVGTTIVGGLGTTDDTFGGTVVAGT